MEGVVPANIVFSAKPLQTQPENGRVVDVFKSTQPYQMFTQNNNKNDEFKKHALGNIQTVSPLSMVYFSKDNMKRIQNLIRYRVWLGSNKKHVISDQSTVELEVVMRSIYLQFSKNMDCKIGEQVYELNSMVANWCVPRILAEIEQYLGYLNDINRLPTQIELPKNMSSAGTRTLRSVTTTF